MIPVSPFRWRRRIGMRDVDAWGIVWHGNYFGFCDEARAELMRAFGLTPATFATHGWLAPLIDAHCRFLTPARYDDEIDVIVRFRMGRSTRMHFDFTIVRTGEDKRIAEISTTQVLVKTSGELIYLIPDDLKRTLDQITAAQATEPGDTHP